MLATARPSCLQQETGNGKKRKQTDGRTDRQTDAPDASILDEKRVDTAVVDVV